MPVARIITAQPSAAASVAKDLHDCGYSVVIVGPDSPRTEHADVELDFDREGAEFVYLTAPEREFVLAPMWRSIKQRLSGWWSTVLPKPSASKQSSDDYSMPSFIGGNISGEGRNLGVDGHQAPPLSTPSTLPEAAMPAAQVLASEETQRIEQEPRNEPQHIEPPLFIAPVLARKKEAVREEGPVQKWNYRKEDRPAFVEPPLFISPEVSAPKELVPPASESELPLPEPLASRDEPPVEAPIYEASLSGTSEIEQPHIAAEEKFGPVPAYVQPVAPPVAQLQESFAPAPTTGSAATPALVAAAMKLEAARANALRRWRDWRAPRDSHNTPLRARDYIWQQAIPAAAGLAIAFLLGWTLAVHATHAAAPADQAGVNSSQQISSPASGVTLTPAGGATIGPVAQAPAPAARAPLASSTSRRLRKPSARIARRRRATRDGYNDVVVRHFDTKPRVIKASNGVKEYSDDLN